MGRRRAAHEVVDLTDSAAPSGASAGAGPHEVMDLTQNNEPTATPPSVAPAAAPAAAKPPKRKRKSAAAAAAAGEASGSAAAAAPAAAEPPKRKLAAAAAGAPGAAAAASQPSPGKPQACAIQGAYGNVGSAVARSCCRSDGACPYRASRFEQRNPIFRDCTCSVVGRFPEMRRSGMDMTAGGLACAAEAIQKSLQVNCKHGAWPPPGGRHKQEAVKEKRINEYGR